MWYVWTLVSSFWKTISMKPLYDPLITEVPIRGGWSSGLVGKSSVYTPVLLWWSASRNGVVGGEYEIPFNVVRSFPLMITGGIFLKKYARVTLIKPYLNDPWGLGRAAPALRFVLKSFDGLEAKRWNRLSGWEEQSPVSMSTYAKTVGS